LDVLAESRVAGGTAFSWLVSGRNVQLSRKILHPVQVSSNMACLIEHEEIRCLPCQLGDQSAGTFLGSQCKKDDPVSLNLFDLIDSCPLQMGAEKLTEGRWRSFLMDFLSIPARAFCTVSMTETASALW